jgi:rhodanese-related sulfurtransferase
MKRIASLLLILAIPLLICNSCSKNQVYSSADEMVAEAAKFVTEITVGELKTFFDEGELFTLIDVREPNEHNFGYIPGSVNLPLGILPFNIGKDEFWENEFLYRPEKEETIVVYCKKGKRGTLAAKMLQDLGYTNILNLEGGWKTWELTYPLEYEKNLENLHAAPHEEEGGC